MGTFRSHPSCFTSTSANTRVSLTCSHAGQHHDFKAFLDNPKAVEAEEEEDEWCKYSGPIQLGCNIYHSTMWSSSIVDIGLVLLVLAAISGLSKADCNVEGDRYGRGSILYFEPFHAVRLLKGELINVMDLY